MMRFRNHKIETGVIGSGRPILFLDGLVGSGPLSISFMKNLGQNYQVYYLNLPGFQRSSGSAKSNKFNAALVDHFIEKLDHPDIIGYSSGTVLALYYALHYKNYNKLVLLHPIAPRSIKVSMNFAKLFIEFIFHFRWSWNNLIMHYTVKNSGPYLSERDLNSHLKVLWSTKRKSILRGLALSGSDNIRQDILSIGAETLIISGTKDQISPLSESRYIHNQISKSKLVEMQDVGHYALWERPKETLKYIEDFLD